jgi:hypothetical protein
MANQRSQRDAPPTGATVGLMCAPMSRTANSGGGDQSDALAAFAAPQLPRVFVRHHGPASVPLDFLVPQHIAGE